MKDSDEIVALRSLFSKVVQMFTTHPADMTIDCNHAGRVITLACRSHAEDSAKIIGTHGATFRSMRDIMRQAAYRLGSEFYLARVKDKTGTQNLDDGKPPKYSHLWPQQSIMRLFNELGGALFVRPFDAEWSHEGDESFIMLTLAQEEDLCMVDDALEDALSIVFCAIGVSHGRKVRVRMDRINPQRKEVCEPSNLARKACQR